MANIEEITWEKLQQLRDESESALIVILFWAPWYKSSTMAKKELEAACANYQEGVRAFTSNVEESPYLAQMTDVREVPMLLFLRDNYEEARMNGLQTRGSIDQRIYRLLS